MSANQNPVEAFRTAIQASIDRRRDSGDAKRTVANFNFGDLYDAVCRIQSVEAARTFYDGYVAHHMEQDGMAQDRAEHVAKSNIGWFYGEGWPEDRIRMWTEACGASHPVFGSMIPTNPKVAFDAGQVAGEQARRTT